MNKDYYSIKPHHFLDYLYELGIGYRHEDEVNVYGSNNAELCRKFSDGEMRAIKFTPFVDDICRPCKKLENGERCTDLFDDETTKLYGVRNKQDFNYRLDIKLNEALPEIFDFDRVWDMSELLYELEKNLTEDIIGLYKWQRPERTVKTFEGIRKGKTLYS